MMLLVVYAVFIWWAALKWRRRAFGFLVAPLGMLGVYFVGRFYLWLATLLGLERPESFIFLLMPFGAIVGLIALYIALLPRRSDGACRKCGYSLGGLEPLATDGLVVCPECGARHVFAHTEARPCSKCGGEVKPHGHRDWVCSKCGLHLLHRHRDRHTEASSEWSSKDGAMDHAQSQHAERQPEDQQQPQREQTLRIDMPDERNGGRLRALGDQIIREAQPVER